MSEKKKCMRGSECKCDQYEGKNPLSYYVMKKIIRSGETHACIEIMAVKNKIYY